MNDELQTLIAQHLDGHLDTAGQRRLAELLGVSTEARQTLARYLRLEGAAIKLAAARQLGLPSADPALEAAAEMNAVRVAGTGTEPPPESAKIPRRSSGGIRWARVALISAAASLLAALVLSPLLFKRQPEVSGEMDLLADNWLEIQAAPQFIDQEPTDVEQPVVIASVDPAEPASESEPVESDLEEDVAAPPSWLVAAMAELANEKSNPGEG